MSCSSSSSSRKSMHGGGSSEFWREYIGGTSLQLFEVIHRAIELAKIDYPDKFLAERDGIAQNLFSHLEKHSKEEEEEVDDIEDGVVVSCFSAKEATIATIEESASTLSKGGRGVGAVAVDRVDERSSQSLHRQPTVTIRCQVRTADKQIPPCSRTQHPRPLSVLKPKSIHHLPPNRHHQPPTDPANPKLVDKKLEATKRKLREAYGEEDRTKRIRRTQLLDFSQSAKLLHQNNATTATAHQLTYNNPGRSRNNNNTWATRRRR